MRDALVLGVILVRAAPARAGEKPTYAHQEYFEHYEGTATCLECHEDAAEAFFHSQHYQWQGEAPAIANAEGQRLGKRNTMNDFCTFPMISWIGNVTNPDGEVLAQGCSKCHAGLGKQPEADMSREQLENIDCLICHASGYRRDLYQSEQGEWEWRPILWKNQQGLDSVAKRISLPQRAMCLRCHAGAGGGPNYKRGDIEYALSDCEPDFDVHMASSGNNMQCVDCHAGQDHRVRGRGADLSGTDDPSRPLGCDTAECHGPTPHAAKVLNHHAQKVYCTVCHIPAFAKADRTDMERDWSRPAYHEDAKKYSATITFGQNVQPVYAWFQGKTHHQLMGEPVIRRDDGTVGIMLPEGERKDKNARLYAFKLHRGKLPVLKSKQWLLPLAVEEFFADGDLEKAINEAAEKTYGIEEPQVEWVPTVRYMGIFHEVAPAARALQCLDCHAPQGRLDWQALGYKQDPLEKSLER
jgi:hypothetical protein